MTSPPAESHLGTYLWAGMAGYIVTTDLFAAMIGVLVLQW